VVLIYGDRQSGDATQTLAEQLHLSFHPAAQGLPPAQARQAPVRPLPDQPPGTRSPDVLTIPISCIGNVPGMVRALIRTHVRHRRRRKGRP